MLFLVVGVLICWVLILLKHRNITITTTGVLGASRKFYRLHGNVPQQVRKSVYSAFCAAEKGILLCTDVAARGRQHFLIF